MTEPRLPANDLAPAPARVPARGAGVVGALLLVLGLLLIATGVFARTHSLGGTGHDDGRVPAAALRGRVEQALASATRVLEPKAMAASRLPEIVSGLDLDADAHTFEDLLQNEDWWAPYRAQFPLSGVVTANGALAIIMAGNGSGTVDVSGSPAVRQAREVGVASGVAAIQGRAFMFAAARVPRGKHHAPGAVVVVGAPIERPVLQAIAEGAGTAVALSDGKRLLAAAGPDAAQTKLAALVGREDRATDAGLVRLDDGPAGVTIALDRGLWLDAALPALPQPAGSHLGLFIAAAGALLGGSGLVIQLSGRRRAKVDTDNPLAITQPMGSGQHLRPAGKPQFVRAKHQRPPAPAASKDPVPAVASSAATAAAMLEPPAGVGVTLGRYRLLERIGEGGMAEIFVAAAHGAEGFVRHFVVKRMHPHLARSRDAVNQFIDEGRLQSGLVHSNIVPVFDFGRVGEEYFLALEYIHGRDLEKIVRRHVEKFGRSLSVPVAFYIMHEVLEALAYAHGRADAAGKNLAIVHRDVAPGNILVSASGEVKLSDFGIAKAEGRMSRTEVGMIKGNVSFMSPEQARGEAVDLRSDLFSAAVSCTTA